MKTMLALISLAVVLLPASAEDKPKMDGTWQLTKGVLAGTDFPEEIIKSIKLSIKGNEYEVTVQGQTIKGSATLDESTTPKRMKVNDKTGPNAEKTIHAIYEVTKDELKVCYNMDGTEYPKEFKSPEGSQWFYAVYKRTK